MNTCSSPTWKTILEIKAVFKLKVFQGEVGETIQRLFLGVPWQIVALQRVALA